MADIIAHPGDEGAVKVVMTDASGAETDDWDVQAGLIMEVQNAANAATLGFINIIDEGDGDPRTAKLEFVAVTPEDLFVDVKFDGRVGPDTNPVHLRSGSIAVEAGEATGGVVQVTLSPVP